MVSFNANLHQLSVRTYAVDGDEEEADQGQDEGYVYGRVAGDDPHVDDSSLQWA